jgi:hypothetical protein
VACHKGGEIWYVDTQTPPRAHLVIQGENRDSNSNPLKLGDGQPVTLNRGISKLAEPRSVRYGLNGDLIICTNDAGFVRIVQSASPRGTLQLQATSGTQFQWAQLAGQRYLVQTCSSLENGHWETQTTNFPTSNSTHSYTLPHFGTQGFLRVLKCRQWPN